MQLGCGGVRGTGLGRRLALILQQEGEIRGSVLCEASGLTYSSLLSDLCPGLPVQCIERKFKEETPSLKDGRGNSLSPSVLYRQGVAVERT